VFGIALRRLLLAGTPTTAKKDVPEHLHYDVRFLFESATESLHGNNSELRDLKWVHLSKLTASNRVQQSVRRMALKSVG